MIETRYLLNRAYHQRAAEINAEAEAASRWLKYAQEDSCVPPEFPEVPEDTIVHIDGAHGLWLELPAGCDPQPYYAWLENEGFTSCRYPAGSYSQAQQVDIPNDSGHQVQRADYFMIRVSVAK